MPILRSSVLICVCTVASEEPRRAAIAAGSRPRATPSSTSSSAGVREKASPSWRAICGVHRKATCDRRAEGVSPPAPAGSASSENSRPSP